MGGDFCPTKNADVYIQSNGIIRLRSTGRYLGRLDSTLKYDDLEELGILEVNRVNEQLKADNNWQSIETIPKDGRSILVLDSDGHVYEAKWESSYSDWDYPFANQHGCGCCGDSGGNPIKWMKIPNREV